MFLEMHDNEAPTLCAAARNLDYMYQAEQHVIDCFRKHAYMALCLLFDDSGKPLRAWKRTADDFEECPVPPGTKPDPRSMVPRKDR